MRDFCFKDGLARQYGVDGAVFLHAIAFWVAKNRAAGRHFHQGRTWTYNSLEELARLFPFWSRRQVERITARLRAQGALLTGTFSPDKNNRTLWYTLSDPVLEAYGLLDPDFTKRGKRFHQMEKWNKESVGNQLEKKPRLSSGEEVPTW